MRLLTRQERARRDTHTQTVFSFTHFFVDSSGRPSKGLLEDPSGVSSIELGSTPSYLLSGIVSEASSASPTFPLQ